jgi:uncharacterized membrane protein YfcA
MREKTIVSTVTLLTSLLGYWYAKEIKQDAVPYVMIGGFIGSFIGDSVAETVTKSNHNK